ncbi:MAG: inositol monophosphatase family protein [Pseudomonadota bacterium]
MTPPASPPDAIAFAESLADAAREIARRWFRAEPPTDRKADASPVTAADREIEAAIRMRISERFPDHGVLGEEQDPHALDADWLWVIDPIDGTKAFMTGKPTFTSLIALTWRGDPVIGVIEAPATLERWVAARGQGARLNGLTAHVRDCASVAEASLYASSPYMFIGEDAAAWSRLQPMAADTLFGADAYHYGLLSAGHCDLVCEADLKPYDFCAVAPVVTEAGGTITDWNGAPLTAFSDGRVLAAGDKARHTDAIRFLGGPAE